MRMSRWKAASIHLCISAAIGAIVGALLLLVWYPPPYAHAAGADELVLLLVGVDLALGPLLTLVVFKTGKKGLKLDLGLIGMVQTAALVYGLSVILRSRPVFLVAVIDHFVLVTAAEIAPADLKEGTQPEFRSLSWTGARLVGAVMPTDTEARNRVVFDAAAGKDLQNLPRTFVDYDSIAKQFVEKAKKVDQLARTYPAVAPNVTQWAQSHDRQATDLAWVSVVAPKGELVMIVDGHEGTPLAAFAAASD